MCPSKYSSEWYHLYYIRNREKILKDAKEYRRQNLEIIQKREREKYQKNKEKIKQRRKNRIKIIRLKVLSHYSGGQPKCACCGETHIEFLTIDHIEGGGTKHRDRLGKFGIYFYLWLINNNFPDGFRVLCSNCNSSKGRYGYCPHEV